MKLGQNYKKSNETSYALGASLTYELLIHQTDKVCKVYFHSSFTKSKDIDKFISMCERNRIVYEFNDRIFNRLSDKEKCLVIAEFTKYGMELNQSLNHIVLVNPANMGNIGTIIRTALGFDIYDIAIVRPAVDIFDPKVIRASMGAFFQMRCAYYDSFEDYRKNSKHELYTFRLDGENLLDINTNSSLYALIFGNESSGLPPQFKEIGKGIKIAHNDKIDSLSLPVAVSIALFCFRRK